MNIQPDFAPPPTKVTDQVIPVIDIGPLLAQEKDAINCVAEQLNIACSKKFFCFNFFNYFETAYTIYNN